jgi:hypothetical protein
MYVLAACILVLSVVNTPMIEHTVEVMLMLHVHLSGLYTSTISRGHMNNRAYRRDSTTTQAVFQTTEISIYQE